MRCSRPRTGSLSVWLLFSMPVLLMLGFLGINALSMNFARGQTQNVADASALAAGYSMVDDTMLLGDTTSLANLEAVAKVQAQAYSNLNPVPPLPIPYADTDFTFTQIVHPLKSSLNLIETLEVTARRTADNNNAVPLFGQGLFTIGSVNVTAKAKVKLDRNVTGFRPVFANNIPVVPIAIAETDTGTMTGWKEKIEDVWNPPSSPADVNSFPTITVTIGLMGQYDPYVLNLAMGSDPADETQNGIPPSDLNDFGGQLIVPLGGNLPIPGTQSAPMNLAAALQTLKTNETKRAFPLYNGIDGSGKPQITRFVAAKVTNVVSGGGTITLTLTPTFLEHPSVVTDANQPTTNPYLARGRLSFP